MLPGDLQGYDVIGDVHGCAQTLTQLLARMGYAKQAGVWRHPTRKALFLGDIIDRGPRIREALHLVHDMVEAGAASCIMGNHEINALAWSTPAPAGSGRQYIREHTERNRRQIQDTLEQFAAWPEEWEYFLDWFYTLPLFMDMGEIRLVHACWDDNLIKPFATQYQNGCIDREFLEAATDHESFASQVLERLLRGIDMRLPHGQIMTGRDGLTRRAFRTKFWEEQPQTYGDIVFQPDALPDEVAARPLSDDQKAELLLYDTDQPILFVGHYWQQGNPHPIRPNLACLDYSAVKYGKLVAYRWEGEHHLHRDHFVWVDVPRLA
ncbi:metallophosphoesterase [Halopseudomonas pelagia]|uniref:Serine/threonine protein phosphatase n=1 Tax=Halopseudomonas pelagia TaxID=553151 RepID=A0AA91Z8N6_9GAMM|nr:metallophosphoesterase [Halopseudomonas pelagia]PCD01251.1 serine/threonine protein phosphatase [Halopseudomonas pelagia]QFY57541.1 serine/threonine protein phosphatase [Halopseudomonas pelagia]